jgi:hypothetical protein
MYVEVHHGKYHVKSAKSSFKNASLILAIHLSCDHGHLESLSSAGPAEEGVPHKHDPHAVLSFLPSISEMA